MNQFNNHTSKNQSLSKTRISDKNSNYSSVEASISKIEIENRPNQT